MTIGYANCNTHPAQVFEPTSVDAVNLSDFYPWYIPGDLGTYEVYIANWDSNGYSLYANGTILLELVPRTTITETKATLLSFLHRIRYDFIDT